MTSLIRKLTFVVIRRDSRVLLGPFVVMIRDVVNIKGMMIPMIDLDYPILLMLFLFLFLNPIRNGFGCWFVLRKK